MWICFLEPALLSIYDKFGLVEFDLPYPSYVVIAHLKVVNPVFFRMDVRVACRFFEISLGVHFVGNYAFVGSVSFCS